MKTLEALRRDWPVAAEIRKLQSRVWSQTRRRNLKAVLITSPQRSEGKTMTLAYLAVASAIQGGRKILAVDMDFRRPSLNQFFDLDVTMGLGDVLHGEAELDDVIAHTELPGLDVLLPGHLNQDHHLLLGAPNLYPIFDGLKERYDLVLMDAPALVPVADAAALIPLSDAVLMVVMAGKTQKPHLVHARELCMGMGANLLGLVVGNMQEAVPDYYEPQQYYGYTRQVPTASGKPARR